MKSALIAAIAALTLGAGMAQAADAGKGEKLFTKQCRSCHAIIAADGAVVVKGGKTGPNLFGVVGRAAASHPDFSKYGKGIQEAAANGLVWDEAAITEYLADPTKFIRAKAGDKKTRSNMSYKVRKEAQRADIVAFLATQK